MKNVFRIIRIPFVYIAIFLLYLFQFILDFSGRVFIFIFRLPIILIQTLITLAITYWIIGQITAIITTGHFLIASYYDMSKYPVSVQNAFIIPQGQTIFNTFNWYVTPLLVIGIIEVLLSIFFNLYKPKNK